MCSKTFSKKKLFVFHNKKTIQHLEQQPNQSLYVENLILKNITNQNTNLNSELHYLLKEIKQQLQYPIKKEEIKLPHQDNSISSSITNILNFK